MENPIDYVLSRLEEVSEYQVYGKVTSAKGLMVECTGLHHFISVGSKCRIETRAKKTILAEVVGFNEHTALLMPFTDLEGVGAGCRVYADKEDTVVFPDHSWKGRVINALGEPIDDNGPLKSGDRAYPFRASPPPAHRRMQVKGKVDLGVRAVNTFLTCCRGQRMGIFAGSGIGKSMLVAMLAKYSAAEVKVIGLIGERGREVQEFIHDYLGEEGLKNSVLVVATSDESALMRRQAAYLTLAVAEYFRDQGKEVLCMMDSVTRFAMAQREIGLSAGEPPTTKGYTPTVFVELPKLLERAGPGVKEGSITGLFTVLVEGDDHNEPISDAVRGILDGHIVLDRAIADRGRFPAINILKSVSRTMPGCNTDEENAIVNKARQMLATYTDMEDMIRLGAYRKGSDAKVDEAIQYVPAIENFLSQKPQEPSSLEAGYKELSAILHGDAKKVTGQTMVGEGGQRMQNLKPLQPRKT